MESNQQRIAAIIAIMAVRLGHTTDKPRVAAILARIDYETDKLMQEHGITAGELSELRQSWASADSQ